MLDGYLTGGKLFVFPGWEDGVSEMEMDKEWSDSFGNVDDEWECMRLRVYREKGLYTETCGPKDYRSDVVELSFNNRTQE